MADKLDAKSAVTAALILKDYCERRRWMCEKCPFYQDAHGQCLCYGFPHTWEPREWQEVDG